MVVKQLTICVITLIIGLMPINSTFASQSEYDAEELIAAFKSGNKQQISQTIQYPFILLFRKLT